MAKKSPPSDRSEKLPRKTHLRSNRKQILEKLTGYVLNFDHPQGKAKAKYFEQSLGFTVDNAVALAKQLMFNKGSASQN